MRFLNRYFFSGLALGVVLTIGAMFAVGLFFVMTLMPSPESLEAMLPTPEFPSHARLSIYGQAEYGWSVRALDGKEIPVSEFKGKVVFLNVWATWCAPCVAEIPSIQNLYNSLNTSDVVFLLISDEDTETVKRLAAERGYDIPLYLFDGELPSAFDLPGVPTTFIINREGLIVFRHVGAAKWDDGACRTFIQRLM